MKKMRVWMLDPSFKTTQYDLHLLNALQEQQVDMELITSQYVHEALVIKQDLQVNYFFFRALEKWNNLLRHMAVARWLMRLLVYSWDILRFQRLLKKNPPDILHIQWTYFPYLDQIIFRRISKRIPIVLTIHNPLVRKSLLSKLDDMTPFTDIAQHVIVHAEQNREMLLQRRFIASDRVHVVPMGPVFEDVEEVTSQQARAHFGLAADVPVILFFGIIKPYKGLHNLIAAMPRVLAAIPHAQLVIAGHPQESLETYHQAIADAQLEKHVILHTHFIPSDQVPYYFCMSNVVCLPYLEASQSAVLLSAYRFGKSVVVTDVGALPETVEHEKNGLVVPVQNVDALAQALIKILSDVPLQQAYGARSREIAQARYSWTSAAEKTVEIYKLLQV